jgi:uncharacterized protein VirK/YbjX
MIIENLKFLWNTSAKVCGDKGLTAAKRRVQFMLNAGVNYSHLKPMLDAPPATALGRFMGQRPEIVGALLWPYQCSAWSARTRLTRIRAHYSAISEISSPFDFSPHEQLVLLDLREITEDLRLVLEQPHWFMREGQLTISLFDGETRIYSLVFSLLREDGTLVAFIGGIQGRDIEGVLDKYRELTKASHGLRPRDLLLELFRMLCAPLGVEQIRGVADEYRQNRSRYFGKSAKTKILPTNYNDIWEDRGGSRIAPTFYQLPAQSQQRELEEIPAKKRGMYRRRYALLSSLKAQLQANFERLLAEQHRDRVPL